MRKFAGFASCRSSPGLALLVLRLQLSGFEGNLGHRVTKGASLLALANLHFGGQGIGISLC